MVSLDHVRPANDYVDQNVSSLNRLKMTILDQEMIMQANDQLKPGNYQFSTC